MNICLREFEVKGILDGTITELWRPVKPQPRETNEFLDVAPKCNFCWNHSYCGIDYIKFKSPFGPAGTRIMGKETWAWIGNEIYGHCVYRANYCLEQMYFVTWKSSAAMPPWASRITLINTGVECKQVRDITEEEAKAAINIPWILRDYFGNEEMASFKETFNAIWNKHYPKYPFESAYGWKLKFEAEAKN